MNLTEGYKDRLQELSGIITENSNDIKYLSTDEGSIYTGDLEFDIDDATEENILAQVDDVVKKSGVYIYNNKDLSNIAYNVQTQETVGVLVITHMQHAFSFDVIVKDEYKRKGIGKELVKIALSHYDDQKEAHGDEFEIEVEVINPDMGELLKKFGFIVKKKLPDGTVLMKL